MNRSVRMFSTAAQALAFLMGLTATAAQSAERQTRSGFAFQLNPLGVRTDIETSWRWRLSESTSPLRRDAHIAVGVSDQVTPTSNQAQAWLEVSPLAILDVRAGASGLVYFGTFGNLVGFQSYESDFRDNPRKARKSEAVSGVGRRFHVSPTLKFKAARISFRTAADFEWWKVRDAPGAFFYEPNRGTLLDSQGDSLVNGSTVLLCDLSPDGSESLRVGVLHDYLRVWDAPANRRQRLGPLALIKLRSRRFEGRDAVLAIAVLNHIEAPNRNGFGGFVALTMSLGSKGSR